MKKDITRPVSRKKKKLIDEFLKTPLQVGESISVKYNALNTFFASKDKENKKVSCTITNIKGDEITVVESEYVHQGEQKIISKEDIVSRTIRDIGANPIANDTFDHIRTVNFTLSSILFGLDILGEKTVNNDYDINGVKIMNCNWNPFVINAKGDKEYYQRDFVWRLKDKQLLIESLYQQIDCGKILIRKRGFEELRKMQAAGETELSFNDIVDGKQRLNTLREFVQGKFKDLHGNKFSDLSAMAQNKTLENQLFSYAEMPENTSDKAVIHQFLKLNFTGVPQSKEHIEFVKEIQSKI